MLSLMAKSQGLSRALFRVIGRKLALKREGRLTQSALAQKAKLTRAAVSAIELGHQGVSLVTLCQLALTLRVEPTELLPSLAELQDLEKLEQETRQELQAHEIVDEFLRGDI
jgi:transcriptional regulator with XRE-family HTH domain